MKLKLFIILLMILTISFLLIYPMEKRVEKITYFNNLVEGFYYSNSPFGFSDNFLSDCVISVSTISGMEYSPTYDIKANGKGECELTIFRFNKPDETKVYKVPIDNIESILTKVYEIGYFNINNYEIMIPTCGGITYFSIITPTGNKDISYELNNSTTENKLYELEKLIYKNLFVDRYLN